MRRRKRWPPQNARSLRKQLLLAENDDGDYEEMSPEDR